MLEAKLHKATEAYHENLTRLEQNMVQKIHELKAFLQQEVTEGLSPICVVVNVFTLSWMLCYSFLAL